jgi:hypothetical protein
MISGHEKTAGDDQYSVRRIDVESQSCTEPTSSQSAASLSSIDIAVDEESDIDPIESMSKGETENINNDKHTSCVRAWLEKQSMMDVVRTLAFRDGPLLATMLTLAASIQRRQAMLQTSLLQNEDEKEVLTIDLKMQQQHDEELPNDDEHRAKSAEATPVVASHVGKWGIF